MQLPEFEDIPYEDYSDRELLLVPLLLGGIAVLILMNSFFVTGAPVDSSIVFVGGTEARISVDGEVMDDPQSLIENAFEQEPTSVTPVPGSGEYIVTFKEGEVSTQQLENTVTDTNQLQLQQVSNISPSLGAAAQQRAILGLVVSFGLMSLLVIGLFRSVIPAVAVIASAVIDILVPLSVMSLTGVELSLGTVGALLMLIGYSVDSDILLNNFVLRSKKTFYGSLKEAMRTGVTMTVTSMSAMIVMFSISAIFRIGLLADMGLVLAIGLGTDLLNTYLMNVGILRWYKGDEI